MSRFIGMAEDVRNNFKGEDINGYIQKYASEHNLNKNETQRLVEEVNVGTFLDKLKDGTHHEDFPVADPLVTHSDGESPVLGSSELNKAASVEYNSVSPSMFDLSSKDNAFSEPMLQKTASVEIGTEIMNSEEKWAENELAAKAALDEESAGLEKVAMEESVYSTLGELTRLANESEGMIKTAASILALNELDELALSLIENSKYSSFDVADARAEELTKEASDKLSTVLEKTAKNTVKDTVEAVKGLGKLIAYPFKHPIIAGGTVAGAMYANSDRVDKVDRDRMEMSLRSFKNEQ